MLTDKQMTSKLLANLREFDEAAQNFEMILNSAEQEMHI